MRLYLTATGRYVGTQDEARKEGKGWRLELVPDQKADLIAYLNDKLAAPAAVQSTAYPVPEPTPAPTPVERVSAVFGCHYQSPLSASTTIAAIDAGMVAAALRQFDGKNLGKVLAAAVERLAELQAQGVQA